MYDLEGRESYVQKVENIYQDILDGKTKKFPFQFWSESNPYRDLNIYIVGHYLFEKVLKWSIEDIRKNTTIRFLRKYKIGAMLYNVYNDSYLDFLELLYPKTFHPWNFRRVPDNYFNNKECRILAVKDIIENDLKWTKEEVYENLSSDVFYKRGCSAKHFSNVYSVINEAYPSEYHPWLFKKFTYKWDKESAKNAVKWLFEEKLNWSVEEIKQKANLNVFKINGLDSLVDFFDGVFSRAIENAYPNRIKPWEYKCAPKGYWNRQTAITATKWLIEEKLKWSNEDVTNKLTKQVFIENGLGGMVHVIYADRIYRALEEAYPGKFNLWALKGNQYSLYTLDYFKKTIDIYFNETLKWSKEDFKNNLSMDVMKNCPCSKFFKNKCNNSLIFIIECLYPELMCDLDSFKNIKVNNEIKKYFVLKSKCKKCA